MKTKISALTLAICFALGTVCYASPQMGTWKLNEERSKFSPGAAKNKMVVYSAVGDKVKVIVDGIDGKGKKAHNEWIGKFDGNDYAVKGDPASDMRSYKMVNERTLELTVKKGGKVMVTGRIIVGADGKSRMVSTTGTDDKGVKMTNVAYFDKQ